MWSKEKFVHPCCKKSRFMHMCAMTYIIVYIWCNQYYQLLIFIMVDLDR